MSSASVIEHQPREQVVVHLRTPGFGNTTVRHPSFGVQRTLRSYYRRPMRAVASAFTDELVAGSMLPRRRAREVAALPELDRARLRRALVVICEVDGWWRALHGSHLSGDERLFAVMFWRRDQRVRDSALDHIRRLRSDLALVPVVKADPVTGASLGRLAVDEAHGAVPATLFGGGTKMGLLGTGLGGVGLAPVHSLHANSLLHEATLGGIAKSLEAFTSVPTVSLGSMAAEGALGGSVQKALLGTQQSLAQVVQQHVNGLASTGMQRMMEGFSALSPTVGPFGVGIPGFSELPFSAIGGVRKTLLGSEGIVKAWLFGSVGIKTGLHGSDGTRTGLAGLRFESPFISQFAGEWTAVGSQLASVAFPGVSPLAGLLVQAVPEWVQDAVASGQFMTTWEGHPLWFLLAGVTARAARRLLDVTRSEVEEVVLHALEAVVKDGEFMPSLTRAVVDAPFLKASQRENLIHGVEHAVAGEYVRAAPPLYWGLEGAFWQVGYALLVVTPQRTRPDNPNRPVGFESMVKRLKLEQEFKTFMTRVLFGTEGNPYRHGDADDGERRQVLYGIAAVAGWLESYAGAPYLLELHARMAEALPGVVERAHLPGLGQAGVA